MKATEQGKATCIGSASWNGRRYSRCSFAKNFKRNGGEAVRDEAGNKGGEKNSKFIASRNGVLQACTLTSALIAPSLYSWCLMLHQLKVGFEMWHLELFTGFVVFISSSLRLLLNTWTDFADSSQAANLQVLCSLQPLDCMFVAFLPGISEELLFRGAILPLFGMNLNGVGVATLAFNTLKGM
ncbi:CAAX amino terminal protease family protein [Arachis hypogaea]|nr:CAAX amino terminal protease family protein [Arachis hypogaea]